jgi:hypothetical protein
MATVQEQLDRLVAGDLSLEQVAADFAARTWPQRKQATEAQAWGVTDDDAPDPNSWAAVDACWALTPAQYATLAAAMAKAR